MNSLVEQLNLRVHHCLQIYLNSLPPPRKFLAPQQAVIRWWFSILLEVARPLFIPANPQAGRFWSNSSTSSQLTRIASPYLQVTNISLHN